MQMTHFVAGNLVQRTRPSVGSHVVLLNIHVHIHVHVHVHVHVIMLPLAWTGVGQLD